MIPSPADIRRHILLMVIVASVVAYALVVSGVAAVALSLLALPALAWRYDNRVGVLLPLSILFLICVCILIAVLGLLSAIHR